MKNTLDFLQTLVSKVIEFWQPKTIGITGSLGKSSTKEFLYTLMSRELCVYKNPKSYNSQITCPMTILNAPKKTEYLILEMGMSLPNELDKLIEMAPPQFSILTMIAHAHIEPFKTLDRLSDEKFKIFSHPNTCLGIYNLDMPYSEKANSFRLATLSYSCLDKSANYYLEQNSKKCRLYYNQKLLFTFTNPLQDKKSIYNLLAAIAMSHHLGLSLEAFKEQIPKVKLLDNRFEVIDFNGITIVNDVYNSCIESVENVLESLPKVSGKKVGVLAAMVEQGEHHEKNHCLMANYARKHLDHMVGFGSDCYCMIKEWKNSKKKWAYFDNYNSLLTYVQSALKPGDLLLLKGSRKYKLERIINDFVAR